METPTGECAQPVGPLKGSQTVCDEYEFTDDKKKLDEYQSLSHIHIAAAKRAEAKRRNRYHDEEY
jgi:hypothetical protein